VGCLEKQKNNSTAFHQALSCCWWLLFQEFHLGFYYRSLVTPRFEDYFLFSFPREEWIPRGISCQKRTELPFREVWLSVCVHVGLCLTIFCSVVIYSDLVHCCFVKSVSVTHQQAARVTSAYCCPTSASGRVARNAEQLTHWPTDYSHSS
jgi:hypothetical protein